MAKMLDWRFFPRSGFVQHKHLRLARSMFLLANIQAFCLIRLFISTNVVCYQRSFSFCNNIQIFFRVPLNKPVNITGSAMAKTATHTFDVYQPRNPKASAYYKCVENHFEDLERAWDGMYASRLGFWRTYVMTVIYKYLDCGDLHMGFARVKCEECGHTLKGRN